MRNLIRKAVPQGAEMDAYPEFREKIRIDRDRLDDAVEEQAHLFMQVCEHHVRTTSFRDQAMDELAKLDARIAREFRIAQAKIGDKCTDSIVSDHLLLHPEHVQAAEKVHNLKREGDRWWALRLSYDQRAKMLRELVGLHASGYFTASASASPRGVVRDALAATARAAQEEHRQQRARNK